MMEIANKLIDLQSLSAVYLRAINKIKHLRDNLVSFSDNEPTDDDTLFWIGAEGDTITIPTMDDIENLSGAAIDDDAVSSDTTWSSEKITSVMSDYEPYIKITVNLIGSSNNVPTGNSVFLWQVVDGGDVLISSSPCPLGVITMKISSGTSYKITASSDQEGFYMPVPVFGVATTDTTVTIRYTELAYPQSIRDLQVLAQLNLAAEVVSIGDEFMTTYTYDGNTMDMPWIVVDINDVETESGDTVQGVWLESKYASIENLQFDKEEQEVAIEETATEGLYYIGRNGSTYTLLTLQTGDTIPYSDYEFVYHNAVKDTSLNMYRYGYNRYTHSAVRQWLNSSGDKGNWWTAQHIGDVEPSQHNTYKGFMAGLSQDFIDCVGRAKHTTYTNSVTDGSVIDTFYDKFFLLSGTELYGSVNDNEGQATPYYKAITGFTSPKNDAAAGRIKYALNAQSSAQHCWSRSALRGYSYHAWNRLTTGQLNFTYYSNYSYRVAPACIIF